MALPVGDEALGEGADYADRFEIAVADADERTAEQWARGALEGMPAALRAFVLFAHRRLLRLRLGHLESDGNVLGWRIVTSQQDLVQLEAEGPLIRAVLLGRRTSQATMVLRTFVFFRRAPAARVTWAVVGPIHRRVAPYLLERAARQAPET